MLNKMSAEDKWTDDEDLGKETLSLMKKSLTLREEKYIQILVIKIYFNIPLRLSHINNNIFFSCTQLSTK